MLHKFWADSLPTSLLYISILLMYVCKKQRTKKKDLQHPVVGHLASLRRVDEEDLAAGLEDTVPLLHHLRSHLLGQFVEQVHAIERARQGGRMRRERERE